MMPAKQAIEAICVVVAALCQAALIMQIAPEWFHWFQRCARALAD